MSSKFEDALAVLYEKEGWTVLRNGWPDFLCVRKRQEGGFDLMGVEVKAKGDKLRANQKLNLAALSLVMPVYEVQEGGGYGGPSENFTLPDGRRACVLIFDKDFEGVNL